MSSNNLIPDNQDIKDRAANCCILLLYGGDDNETYDISLSITKKVAQAFADLGFQCALIDTIEALIDAGMQYDNFWFFNCSLSVCAADGTHLAFVEYNHYKSLNASLSTQFIFRNKFLTKKLLSKNFENWMIPHNVYHSKIWPYDIKAQISKPICGGGSKGIKLLPAWTEGRLPILEPYEYNGSTNNYHLRLVEDYVPGIDVTVAGIGKTVIGAMSIAVADPYYSNAAKYSNQECEKTIPPNIDPNVLQEIVEFSRIILAESDLGFSRIDFRYNPEDKKAWFLEVNTMPGIDDNCMFAQICKNNGIDLKVMLAILLIEKGFLEDDNTDASASCP